MTEAEVRSLLLLRAFAAPGEAARIEAHEAHLTERAERLVEREPVAAAALRATAWPRHAATALLLLAGIAGFALDSLGTSGRIHLLSAPLGLLAWNAAVYLLLALHALRGASPPRSPSPSDGPLRSAAGALLRRLGGAQRMQGTSPSARFAAHWVELGRPLHRERVAMLLHLGAAALAAGLLASLYLRGLFFEYRAGWDSTFLTPGAVHRMLSIVLWPALQLTGNALPSADALAALRFSAGGGENAARWIHWLALTVGIVVVLPRAALAGWAAARARRMARDFPLPPAERGSVETGGDARGYASSVPALSVRVLPYSHWLPESSHPQLRAVLEQRLGATVALHAESTVVQGDEDEPRRWLRDADLAARPAPVWIPLFALTATPERETHGAFAQALFQRTGDTRRLVLIDESAFRLHFGTGGGDGSRRLAERRAAWQRMLDALGCTAWFVDLRSSDSPAS